MTQNLRGRLGVWALLAALSWASVAQSVSLPVGGLLQRGAVQSTDLVVVTPANASTSLRTTVGDIATAVGANILSPAGVAAIGVDILSPAAALNPYNCPGFVLGQSDSTSAIQSCLNTAAANGVWFDGLNIPLNASQLSIPSHSRDRNLVVTGLPNATTTDYSPILLDGTVTPVTDVVLQDVSVDGDRVGQTNIVGDGKRQGIALNGRLSNISIVRPVVKNAATDCIRSDIGPNNPSSGTDYYQVNVSILEADLQDCGRHGWSGMSLQNFRFTGSASNNGKNVSGFSGPYTSGGNARTLTGALGGALYGDAIDGEDEGIIGGGFNGIDMTVTSFGNAGGVVFTSDVNLATATGFVTSKNLTLRVNGEVGNYGVGLTPLGVENNVYSSGLLKTFENVNIQASVRNDAMRLDGIDKLVVNAVHGVGLGVTNANSAIVTNTSHQVLNIVSDTTAAPQIYLPALPFSATATQFYGAPWSTLASPMLSYVGFVPGAGMRVTYTALITPAGAGTDSANLTLTTGSVVTDVSGSFLDQTTGAFLSGGAHTPGTAGANSASFGFTAANTDPILVSVSMTVKGP